jgi:hypothetical protein
MSSATVRITPRGHRILSALVEQTRSTMPEILDEALECYRRQKFLDEASVAYDALSQNAKAWQSYRQELTSLDATLNDGLED